MVENCLFADAELPWLGIMAGTVVVLFLSFTMLLVSRYKRCPSNKVLVIYGKVGGGNRPTAGNIWAARRSRCGSCAPRQDLTRRVPLILSSRSFTDRRSARRSAPPDRTGNRSRARPRATPVT